MFLSSHAKLFNTLQLLFVFSVFYFIFYHYITLYYFLQFSNIIIHTHVTWLASAYYCFFFVSYFVLKRELVFGFPYFCYFYLLVSFSYLNYQRSSLLLFPCYRFRSLFSLSRSRSLAQLLVRLFSFPSLTTINIMLLLRLLRLLFSLLLHLHPLSPVCLHTTHHTS